MAELQEIELGPAGTDYLSYAFRNRGLCSYLGRLPLSTGITFAPLPFGTTLARAQDLKNGGLPPNPDRDRWLADHVLSLFGGVPRGTFIIQDVWGARPGDPGLRFAVSRMLFTKEVYYIVTLD